MKKEKLMPIGQQIAHIQRYLSNRGITASKTAIKDYMSPDLHYDENKTAVTNVLLKEKRRQHKHTDIEAMLEQAQAHDDARSERAQAMDYSKCASNAYTIKDLLDDPKKASRWFERPNRFDVIGVDAKDKCGTVKRKKQKRK